MALNCTTLQSILRDCSSAIGGIDTRIYINDSENVDWDNKTMGTGVSPSPDSHVIATIDLTTGGNVFEIIEFRKNIASLTEDYSRAEDGAVVFTQTLTLPIHGRDAAKSRKISVLAAGQREVDIILQQNDGNYVYLRKMQLLSTADGTGAAKTDGSKYTLVFDGQSETLAYFLDPTNIPDLITP